MSLALKLKTLQIRLKRSEVTNYFANKSSRVKNHESDDVNLNQKRRNEADPLPTTEKIQDKTVGTNTKADKFEFEEHNDDMKHAQGEQDQYHCEPCKRSFDSEWALTVHSWSHNRARKSYDCPHCGKDCKAKSKLKRHIRGHHSKPRHRQAPQLKTISENIQTFQCSQCEKTCESQELLDRHIQSKHQNRTCKLCGKVFRFVGLLQNHMAVHTKERPFQCQQCKKAFPLPHHLKRHSEKHTADDFQCNFCKLTFVRSHHLVEHLADMHSSLNIPSKPLLHANKMLKTQPNPSKIEHLKTELKIQSTASSGQIRKHNCPKCSKVFRYSSQLKHHMTSHSNVYAFSCLTCEKTYKYSNHLNEHIKTNKGCSGQVQTNHLSPFRPKLSTTQLLITQKGKCPICRKYFRTAQRLRAHMVVHSGEKPYECPQCKKLYAYERGLRKHLKKHSENDVACTKCELSFHKKHLMEEHMLKSHVSTSASAQKSTATLAHKLFSRQNKCPKCSRVFKCLSRLQQHLASHSNKRPFQCTNCLASFKYSYHLTHHNKTCKGQPHQNHTAKSPRVKLETSKKSSVPVVPILSSTPLLPMSKRPVKCPICKKTFSRVHALRGHMVVHTGEKPFKCDKCNNVFAFQPGLIKHSKTHTANDFRCNLCALSFPLKVALKRHLEKSHVDGRKPHRAGIPKLTQPRRRKTLAGTSTRRGRKRYSCPECSKDCPDSWKLRRHMVTHTGEKPFQCKKCMKSFGFRESWNSHTKLHAPDDLKCTKCVLRFITKRDLRLHTCQGITQPNIQTKVQVRGAVTRNACVQCSKAFPTPAKLKIHMISHSDARNFRCTGCEMAFKYPYQLSSHRRMQASCRNPKDYVESQENSTEYRQCQYASVSCPYCFKSFQHSNYLKKHLVVHTKEKPFQCPKCMTSFSFERALQRHSKKHTVKDIKCELCNLKFIAKTQYLKHLDEKHRPGLEPKVNPPLSPSRVPVTSVLASSKSVSRQASNRNRSGAHSCQLCFKKFFKYSSLSVHMISHSNARNFKCSRCESTFKYLYHLKRHRNQPGSCKITSARNTKKNTIPTRCSHCDQCFSSLPELEAHAKVHEQQPTSTSKTLVMTLHQCKICKEVFISSDQLIQHLTLHDSNTPAALVRPIKPPNNPLKRPEPSCSTDANSSRFVYEISPSKKQKMQNSSTKKDSSFPCPYCDRSFSYEHLLRSHVVVHSRKDPLQCTVCQEKFKWHMQLYRHLKRTQCGKRANAISESKSVTASASTASSIPPETQVTEPTAETGGQHLCKICGWDYLSKARLLRHSLTHRKKNNFPCVLCNLRFAAKHLLERHNADVHGEEQIDEFECQECELAFPTQYLLKLHFLTHNQSTSSAAMGPATVQLEAPREMFNCKYCGKHFFRKDALTSHLRSAHAETTEEKLQCTTCDQEVVLSEISAHMQIHLTEPLKDEEITSKPGPLPNSEPMPVKEPKQNLKCNYCGKILSSPWNLRNHIKLHLGQRPFKCEIGDCQAAFVTKSELGTHQKGKQHAAGSDAAVWRARVLVKDDSLGISSEVVFSEDFECKLCGKILSNSKTFRNHMKLHSGNRSYKCGIDACQRTYFTASSLSKHRRVYHSTYVMNKKKQSVLKKHRNLANAAIEKRLKVQNVTSQSELSSEENPKQPEQNTEKVKSHACHICSKAFARGDHLRVHIKYHLGIRDYKCDLCDQSFFQKTDLVAHQSVHTGIKPFVCQLCYLGFGYKQSLKAHLKSHENK